MAIEYTRHAILRMKYRAVLKGDVENTLESPDFGFATRLGRFVALKRFGDKFLKVVYEKSNDKIIVITVYWTRRLRRR